MTEKKKATPKVMRLIDPWTGKMECPFCGYVHWAMTKSGGGFYRGAWQCENKCRHPEKGTVETGVVTREDAA